MRVLIVDDELEQRDLLQSVLQSWGHTVYSASNGVEALDLVHQIRRHAVHIDQVIDLAKTAVGREHEEVVLDVVVALGAIRAGVVIGVAYERHHAPQVVMMTNPQQVMQHLHGALDLDSAQQAAIAEIFALSNEMEQARSLTVSSDLLA